MNSFTRTVIWVAAISLLALAVSSATTLISAIWSCWLWAKVGLSVFVISFLVFVVCEAATNSKHFQDD